MEFSIICPCFGKGKKFSNNSNLTNLVDIQHWYENDELIICVPDGAYTFLGKRSYHSTQLY